MNKMQITNSSDISMKPIKVKKKPEEKYPAGRHLSRNMSTGTSSREIYYGDSSVAIPFMWESQPGTPIVNFQNSSCRPMPPLTPPPSFVIQHSPAKKFTKKHSKSNLFQGVLPKLSLKKSLQIGGQSSPGSLSSSNSSSSSSSSSPWRASRSVPSSPISNAKARGEERFSRVRSPLRSRKTVIDDDDDQESSGGRPTLCFGIRRGSNVRTIGFSASLFKLMIDDDA